MENPLFRNRWDMLAMLVRLAIIAEGQVSEICDSGYDRLARRQSGLSSPGNNDAEAA